MPKVSVIIPNYNHVPFVEERIDSVLNQTFQDFEVIILDDCSTDNSRGIIEQYRNNPKVSHIIFNDKNSGSTFKQWNKGISLAKAEWIWLAESDDVAELNLLEELLKPLVNQNVVLSYCQSKKINSDGVITGSWIEQTINHQTDFRNDFVRNGKDFIKNDLIHRNVIPNASAVLFNKSVYNKVGGVDNDIKYNSDWLLWLKILNLGDIAFTSKELNRFRFHSKSVIASAKNDHTIIFNKKFDIIMFERFISTLKDNEMKNNFKFKLSYFSEIEFRELYKHGFIKESKLYLLKGFKYSQNKIFYIFRNIKYLIKSYNKICSQ